MHCAVKRDPPEERAEVIRYLARHGAPLDDVQFQDKKSFRQRGEFLLGTPLYMACESKDYISASVLLELGADLDRPCRRFGRPAGPTPREVLALDVPSLA